MLYNESITNHSSLWLF